MADDIKHFVSNRFGSKGMRGTVSDDRKQSGTPSQSLEEYATALDLRKYYPYSCSPIFHNDRVHYLDKDSADYFQRLLERNHNHYSETIFQSVMKYAVANVPEPQTDEETDGITPAIIIPAGYSQNRQESRLNFATDVEIEMPSGTLIMSRSVDISASGIQLRVTQLLDVISGMELKLSFPQLEQQQEHQFGQVTYVLKKHTIGSLHMSLFLVRKEPGTADFDHFIEEFIRVKKHRYRIDSEDSVLALCSKAWEYLYIKSLPYLAAFISTDSEKMQIQELAISESNQQQSKGLSNMLLSHIERSLTSFRLNGIASKEIAAPEIYAFRQHSSGLRRRLCIASWEFKEPNERLNFLRSGIREESFIAWRIEAVKLSELPKSRSRELLSLLVQESDEQASNLIAQLNQYDHLLYLIDISDQIKRDPILHETRQQESAPDQFFDDYEVSERKSAEYTSLRLGLTRRRNETRYIYSSPVVLKHYGEKIKGQTVDFSVNGLKVKTDQHSRFQIRDSVNIEFNGFNRKFRSAKLKSEPYRVVAITRDGAVCLSRDHRVSQHKAASFLKRLIEQNEELLKHCTGDTWMSTKTRLMEAWMHQCLPTQALLVGRKSSQYYIPYIISSHTTEELLKPFEIGSQIYNLNPLLENKQLTATFRHMQAEKGNILHHEIFVSQPNGADGPLELKLWEDFESDIQRNDYLRAHCKFANFRAYHLAYSMVPRLDKTDLSEEMNVVRKNARHRLQEFEETYQSLVGIFELMDATKQIKQRYNLQ